MECKGEAGGDIADKRELDKANSKTERGALEKGDRRREKTMETKMDDGTNQH